MAVLGLPTHSCSWISAHVRSVTNVEHFALVYIVNFGLAVGAADSGNVIISVNFKGEDFCVDIAKEVDDSDGEEGGVVNIHLSRFELLLLLMCLLKMKDCLHLLESDRLSHAALFR